MNYLKRIVDQEIQLKMKSSGAVVVRGPKWCGKTTTCTQFAKSKLELQNPDLQDNYLKLANTRPSVLLSGDKPRLIDEWQLAPKLWDAIRYDVDKTSNFGDYLLTGSSVPNDDPKMHSGVGRFAFVTMKSMSLYESGDSNGTISLKDIIEGNIDIDGKRTDLEYERIAYVLCRGGWPNSVTMNEADSLQIARNYVDTLCESDISRIDGVKRNSDLARMILKSYARQISTINSDKSIYADVVANYREISDKTVLNYINVLKKLYIIEEVKAWNPNIRSKTMIRTSPKKSFVDPSIAVAVLDVNPQDLILDINTFGLLFENLVTRDLSIYTNSIKGRLNHYRDSTGLECDNIIHFNNGTYALVEIKLSGYYIAEADKHLNKLRNLIIMNEPLLGLPEFMMIITGTDLAYTTESGVLVVPIGCLKD